jgi:hypothetical protein
MQQIGTVPAEKIITSSTRAAAWKMRKHILAIHYRDCQNNYQIMPLQIASCQSAQPASYEHPSLLSRGSFYPQQL